VPAAALAVVEEEVATRVAVLEVEVDVQDGTTAGKIVVGDVVRIEQEEDVEETAVEEEAAAIVGVDMPLAEVRIRGDERGQQAFGRMVGEGNNMILL